VNAAPQLNAANLRPRHAHMMLDAWMHQRAAEAADAKGDKAKGHHLRLLAEKLRQQLCDELLEEAANA
jgi:hypothetical protein